MRNTPEILKRSGRYIKGPISKLKGMRNPHFLKLIFLLAFELNTQFPASFRANMGGCR